MSLALNLNSLTGVVLQSFGWHLLAFVLQSGVRCVTWCWTQAHFATAVSAINGGAQAAEVQMCVMQGTCHATTGG